MTTGRKLVLITFAAAILISLWLRFSINFNSPYIDESDYLFVGRLLLSGVEWPNQSYIFSSDLPLYLIGVADAAGGIQAARILSLITGLISLYFSYKILLGMSDDYKIALSGTLILALNPVHIFLSKFATYDIYAFTFLIISLYFLQRFLKIMNSPWLAGALIFLIASIFSKYIILPYAAPFFLIVFLKSRKLFFISILVFLVILIGYFLFYMKELRELYLTQITGTHSAIKDPAGVIYILFYYCGLMIMAALVSILIKSEKSDLFGVLFMVTCSLPLPVYHLLSQNPISFFKHTIYPSAFLIPVLIPLLKTLTQRDQSVKKSLVTASALSLYCIISVFQVREMENGYPDTSGVESYLNQNVKKNDILISEDSYLLRYLFYPRLALNQLFETSHFDNNKDHVYERKDVIDAVWEGKFDYVYLNGQITPLLGKLLADKVLKNSYELVYFEKYSLSSVFTQLRSGELRIYKARHKYQGKFPIK